MGRAHSTTIGGTTRSRSFGSSVNQHTGDRRPVTARCPDATCLGAMKDAGARTAANSGEISTARKPGNNTGLPDDRMTNLPVATAYDARLCARIPSLLSRAATLSALAIARSNSCCEKARRPQFVRIAEFFGLTAGQVFDPGLGFSGDRRCLAGPRPVIERCHRAFDCGPLHTALDRLMVRPHGTPHRKKTTGFSDRPAVSAPAPPGSPAPSASG
jgi:hypothetical protein